MTTDPELKRMYWHSRRGMLELDLILVPFAEQHLQALDADGRECYRLLLQQEDQDLYTWLMQRQPAPEPLQAIVRTILDSRGL